MCEACVKAHKVHVPPQKLKAHLFQRKACVARPKHEAHVMNSKAHASNAKAPACIKRKGYIMVWRPKPIQALTF